MEWVIKHGMMSLYFVKDPAQGISFLPGHKLPKYQILLSSKELSMKSLAGFLGRARETSKGFFSRIFPGKTYSRLDAEHALCDMLMDRGPSKPIDLEQPLVIIGTSFSSDVLRMLKIAQVRGRWTTIPIKVSDSISSLQNSLCEAIPSSMIYSDQESGMVAFQAPKGFALVAGTEMCVLASASSPRQILRKYPEITNKIDFSKITERL